MTSQGLWFDSSHRFGDEYKREYGDEGKLTKLYNVRNKWKAKVYAYDEWNRLIECRADDYTVLINILVRIDLVMWLIQNVKRRVK